MLTAAQARELVNDLERRKQARKYIEDYIMPAIEKQALKGDTGLFFETCQPELDSFIISELENLGYRVKSNSNIFNLRAWYVIEW